MKIRSYSDSDFNAVDALWRLVFPDDPARNRAAAAIPAKLAMDDDLFLVAEDAAGRVIGTAMAGYDGHRGWLYAVAVDPAAQGSGVGEALVTQACARLGAAGCVKVNLQVREGNPAAEFYRKLGFAEEARVSMGLSLDQ